MTLDYLAPACSDSRFTLRGKVAQVTVEGSQGVTVSVDSVIGALEVSVGSVLSWLVSSVVVKIVGTIGPRHCISLAAHQLQKYGDRGQGLLWEHHDRWVQCEWKAGHLNTGHTEANRRVASPEHWGQFEPPPRRARCPSAQGVT
jgi:hypothetical protein